MNDEELLAELKREMVITAARAAGARSAWAREMIEQSERALSKKHDIHRGDRLCVLFNVGYRFYVYRKLEIGYGETEPYLWGVRVLKSGRLSSGGQYNERICKISYLNTFGAVKKASKPAAKPRATKSTSPRKPTSTPQPWPPAIAHLALS
jgi:hypothetical protein